MADDSYTLPQPDPHMADLDWFLGHWRIQSRMLQDTGSTGWIEERLRAIHTAVLGGNLIFEHFQGPLGGKAFEAWSLRKYDAQTGKWSQRWVDSTPGGPILNWIGRWDADTRTFTGYGERYLGADGEIAGEVAVREVFDDIQADQFKWRFERTGDGGKTWDVRWTLDYTRERTT